MHSLVCYLEFNISQLTVMDCFIPWFHLIIAGKLARLARPDGHRVEPPEGRTETAQATAARGQWHEGMNGRGRGRIPANNYCLRIWMKFELWLPELFRDRLCLFKPNLIRKS